MTAVSVVLAAGHGRRMASRLPKVLHSVAGKPMVLRVLDSLRPVSQRIVVVVGPGVEDLVRLVEDAGAASVVQERRRGTGDALLCARPAIEGEEGDLLVACGDVPLASSGTYGALLDAHRARSASATVLTARLRDPRGYGRILRDSEGRFEGIVEERDAEPAQRAIEEVNTGLCAFRLRDLWPALERLGMRNAQGEKYLTDVFAILGSEGRSVEAVPAATEEEVLGVNTRAELARASRTVWDRNARRLMEGGVSILDPACTWIGDEVEGGRDAVVHPGCVLEGRTRLAAEARVGPWSRLKDCEVGEGAQILDHCVLEDARLEDGAVVGPFARLRGGAVVGPGAVVGNFVEVKDSRLGAATKAKHLAYLGNADIGAGANVGAGTITCNHDGFRKHPTTMGDGAYIGSNSTLVAPVTVGRGAYVAAGSVVTEDVPDDALAIGRCRQTVKDGWAARRREREQCSGGGKRDTEEAD